MVGDDDLSIEALDDIFSDNRTMQAISTAMRDFNGHYAIVHITDRDIYAVVDRVRSIPLFYGHDHQGVYISDDPFWIQEQIHDHDIDESAKREFLLTGYVTDDRTLSSAIKQVRSGEVVHLALDHGEGVKVERGYYQHYVPKDYFDNDLEAILKELDKVLVNSFQRLIKEARGRALVVPLSGGYDSRLIVLMLKRLGYGNIIAFSYGRPDNPESRISKRIADALVIRWEFIEYSNEKWLQWYQSDENSEYYPMGSGLSSLPHLQDWPAVKVLKENHLIPYDSIFLPGHTIANPSQLANLQLHSHSVRDERGMSTHNVDTATEVKDAVTAFPIEQLINDIVKDNYNLKGGPIDDTNTLKEVKGLVLSSLDDVESHENYVSAYEYWNFNERQVKFIYNSVRVYEFWGYAWWLPLLDKEFMDFWCRVPYKLRLDKRLVKIYIDRLSKEMLNGVETPHHQKSMDSNGVKRMTRLILKNRIISRLIRYPFYYHRKITLYRNHPQAYFGMVPWEEYRKEYTGRESINYFTALDFIERLTRSSDKR